MVFVEQFFEPFMVLLIVFICKGKERLLSLINFVSGTQRGLMQERPCESFVSLELQDAMFGKLLLKAAIQHCSLS